MAGSLPRFLAACRCQPADTTPVWFLRQAGRYLPSYRALRQHHSILEICKKPELAAEVTLTAAETLGVDAAIIFADLLLPVEAMGMSLRFAEGEGPVVEPPVRDAGSIARLRSEAVGELGFVAEAIRRVVRHFSGRVPVIGFAGAPFTVASYMVEGGSSRDFLHTKSLLYQTPAAWAALMEKLCAVLEPYLLSQVEAGAQAIQLFDSWVGCLSEADYRTYVLPYSQRLIRAVQARGVPVIHFSTGTAGMLPALQEAGAQVLSVDWRIPLGRAWKAVGYQPAIQGNLDPAALLAPWPELRRQVEVVLAQANGRPGHIFNLGHGILPGTPVENVRAVVAHVHASGARRAPGKKNNG
ncbi:MAG: uroporphyrinogen decarboxylase [Terriglobia bacterium]